MLASYKKSLRATFLLLSILALCLSADAQSGSSVTGTVLDPSGAVVIGATVEMRNPVSGFSRTTTTDVLGRFSFSNVPFNPYHLTVTAKGFVQDVEDVDLRSALGVDV